MSFVLNSSFIKAALTDARMPCSTTGSDTSFTSIVTDSRKIISGCLFIGIRGDSFDGNDFAQEALQKGAAGVIVSPNCQASSPDKFVLNTEDTMMAFRAIAHRWRMQFRGPVLLIAGAVGKTTTKELCGALISKSHPQHIRTSGSENGFLGIPITLMKLDSRSSAAIIEVGIDDMGAMAQHLDVVMPTAALVTAVAPEHMENLKTMENVAKEECIAMKRCHETGGIAVVGIDDAMVAAEMKGVGPKRVVTYSMKHDNFSTSERHLYGSYNQEKNTLTIRQAGKDVCILTLPLQGSHNAMNLLAAAALASTTGTPFGEMNSAISNFTPPFGRSAINRAKAGFTVVCDYYNASPASMRAGMKLTKDFAEKNNIKAIACCLGDMLELGEEEELYHRELAEPIREMGFSVVVLVGKRMKHLASALEGKVDRLLWTEAHDEAARQLETWLTRDYALLIKGSRGLRMEKVANALGIP